MKARAIIFALLIFFPSTHLDAQVTYCDKDGTSIVYVNGIFTDDESFSLQKQKLESTIRDLKPNLRFKFIPAHNDTHLGGAGDLAKAVIQSYKLVFQGADVDSGRMLEDIRDSLTTRKVLLVGHSQGSFYTNQLYLKMLELGVPKESISVYNIASPAWIVWGRNSYYLTSSNDTLINEVRAWTKSFHSNEPLPANITLPRPEGSNGHSLADDYLRFASNKIAGDIEKQLRQLSATSSVAGPCFAAPEASFLEVLDRALLYLNDWVIYAAGFTFTHANSTSVVGAATEIARKEVATVLSVIPKAEASVRAAPPAVQQGAASETMALARSLIAAIPATSTPAPEVLVTAVSTSGPAIPVSLLVPLYGTPGFGGGGSGPVAVNPQSDPSSDPLPEKKDPIADPVPASGPAYIPEIYLTEIHVAKNYIEVFNASSSTISLDDLAISADDKTFPLGGSIAPSEYKVFSNAGLNLTSFSKLSLLLVSKGTTTIETVDRSLLGSATKTRYSALLGDEVADVSFEREGTTNVWHQNDLYTTGSFNGEPVYGTPASANSAGLPEAGISCSGTPVFTGGNANADFVASDRCTIYTSFLREGATREAILFGGVPYAASSTFNNYDTGEWTGSVSPLRNATPEEGTNAPSPYFLAVFEIDPAASGMFGNSDYFSFSSYFYDGQSGAAPNANFRLIPWVYAGPDIPPATGGGIIGPN